MHRLLRSTLVLIAMLAPAELARAQDVTPPLVLPRPGPPTTIGPVATNPIALLLVQKLTTRTVRDLPNEDGEGRRKSIIRGLSIGQPLPVRRVVPFVLTLGIRVELRIVRPEFQELYETRFPFAAALFLRLSPRKI